MRSITVTLEYVNRSGNRERRDLDLPGEISVQQLKRGLVVALGLLSKEKALSTELIPYRLANAANVVLPDDKFLTQCDVGHGAFLIFYPIAYLVSPSGKHYILNGDSSEIKLGRSEPGDPPGGLDLSGEADGKTVSHRHAYVQHEPPDWILTADSSAQNRTQINGHVVPAGQRFRIRHGDEIRLGRLKLQFLAE